MGSNPGPTCARAFDLIARLTQAAQACPRAYRSRRSPTALSERGIAAKITTTWGCSSAGRASRSQCEGREFDPPQLHQHPLKGRSCRVFWPHKDELVKDGHILLVEDSENDIELTLAALAKHVANEVKVARDGAEALDYLYRR